MRGDPLHAIPHNHSVPSNSHPEHPPSPPSVTSQTYFFQFFKMVGYSDPLCDISTWKKRSPYFIKAGPPEARRYPGFHPHSVETPEGLLIEYDVAVPLRDGVKMYVDIYRPAKQDSSTKIPCVI